MRATSPNLRPARAQWPGRGEGSHSGFARRKHVSRRRGRKKRRFGSFAAVGKVTRRRGGGILLLRGCAFLSDQKGTKESPGDAAIGPAAKPPGPPCRLTPGPPLRGTHPGQLFLASGADDAVDCRPSRAAAAGREGSGERSGWMMEARLVQAAVGAGSETSGGWYPPLRKQRRGGSKKPGREGNSLVQAAEMANQHLTNVSGGGPVGILGQNPDFLIHVERKHHRNAFFLVRHIIHLRDILREYPLKVNEQGGTTS